MTLKQFVVRTAPLTHEAMLVDVASRDNGRLKAIIGNREIEIGMDTYAASGAVDLDAARKIVHAYTKAHNIPDTDVLVRVRLPKTNVKPRAERKTNDVVANSLTLVKGDASKDALANAAQSLQDAHDKKIEEAVKPLEELASDHNPEQKASADNPSGATVKRTEGEKKGRRKYTKQKDAQSARSKAAMARYLKEIGQVSAQSPTLLEPVAPGPGVTQEQVDEATLNLAMALAKILRNHKVL